MCLEDPGGGKFHQFYTYEGETGAQANDVNKDTTVPSREPLQWIA